MERLTCASGGRKTSKAVAELYNATGDGGIVVNGRSLEEYFPNKTVQEDVKRPLTMVEEGKQYQVKARVIGGGPTSQAEAVRLAISRGLVKLHEEMRPQLRKEDLLTRDPRRKERKKYGQRGARRGFQWTKR